MIFKELPSFEALLEGSERYPNMNIKECVAWINIVHVGAILQRRIEQELAKEKLTYGRFVIMVLLACSNEGLSVSRLANMSGVTSATISEVIANMSREGLARRSTDAADKRIVRVHLTQSGQETINKIAPAFFMDQSATMSGLDDDEIRSLVVLLSRVNIEA